MHRAAQPLAARSHASPWSVFVFALLGLWATLSILGPASSAIDPLQSAAAVAIGHSVPDSPTANAEPSRAATTVEQDLEDDDDAAAPAALPVAASDSRPHVRPDGVGDPSARHAVIEVFRPPEGTTR